MKDCMISLGILAGILAFCLFSNNMLAQRLDRTTSHLERAYNYARSNEFENATDEVRQASKHWRAHADFFGIILHHDETDELNGAISKLIIYSETNTMDEFCAQCRDLILRIQHINHMQKPKFHNILTRGAVRIGKEPRFAIRDSFCVLSDLLTFQRGAY